MAFWRALRPGFRRCGDHARDLHADSKRLLPPMRVTIPRAILRPRPEDRIQLQRVQRNHIRGLLVRGRHWRKTAYA